ncbi:MAG: class I SAM-dependent methyltransferase [Pseudodesulfovibrio sp.]
MSQPQINVEQQAVKAAVSLLTQGTPDAWNRHYRSVHFQSLIQEKTSDALFMDFEYKDRKKLYHCVNDRFIRKAPIDYCEFGVYGGKSFKNWLELNPNPESRFYGFDSFEGLPEDWTGTAPKGAFTTKGSIPETDDPRASFIVGLFQDTVEEFSRNFTPENRLVLHMDADLYSSTLYCLMNFNSHIKPGTIILFDEFTARNYTDEFAALQDYCLTCYRDYKIIATRTDYVKLAIEITK